jgi:PncC family amidohydrolase
MRFAVLFVILLMSVPLAGGYPDQGPAAAPVSPATTPAASCRNQSDCGTGAICSVGQCRDATIDMYSYSDEIDNASVQFLEALRQRQLNVVTAESLTGGMIASSLVDIPLYGSYIYGGFATYDSDAKRQFLGVTTGDVYTKECSLEMAEGALVHSRALVGVAVTGKAGPVQKTDLDSLGIVDVGVSIRTDRAANGSDIPADPSFPKTFTSVSRRIDTCGADGHQMTRDVCEKYKIEAAADEHGFVSPGVLELVRKLIRQDTVINALRIGLDHVEKYDCRQQGDTVVCSGLSELCTAGYDGTYSTFGEPSYVIARHLGKTPCAGFYCVEKSPVVYGITIPTWGRLTAHTSP